MRRIDTTTENRVIALYNAGDKINYIAVYFGIGRQTVIDILRRNHVPKRKRQTMRENMTEAKRMQSEGRSAREIASRLGCSVSTVYSLLRLGGAK